MSKPKKTPLAAALGQASAGPGSAKLEQPQPAALPSAAARPVAQTDEAAEARPRLGARVARADRAGRVNVTGYFDPAVKTSFRLIQARYPERTQQDLLAEALNDLFAKYNVPQSAKL